MNEIDKVFASPVNEVEDFSFDDKVTAVFPDMIKRSVPGYETIIKQIGTFAKLFVTENSNVYDLGCSLGAATLSMRRNIKNKDVKVIAVDNSESMVRRCTKIISAYESDIPVEVCLNNIENIEISNASMVVLNFTLQFLDKNNRKQMIEKIVQGLKPGGILVLSEKIHFTDPVTQKVIDNMHLDFKRENGYSELEISQKREALQNILIPETFDAHRSRLLAAGFRSADIWYQQYNFASMVAMK